MPLTLNLGKTSAQGAGPIQGVGPQGRPPLQQGGNFQGGNFQGGFQGGSQQGGPQPWGPMIEGGPMISSMVEVGGSLFVGAGDTVYKLNPETMKVDKTFRVPRPRLIREPGQPGAAPGNGGGTAQK